MPIRLVIFDVAGTITEDRDEVLAAFRTALQNNGIEAEESHLREWKGASKREVIRHFVERQPRVASGGTDARVKRIYEDFRGILEGHYHRNGVSPIAGAQNTFDWLRNHDIRLATTTGFYRELNDLILQQAGWQRTFNATICSDDVPVGRPAPFMIFRAMEAAKVLDVAQVINVGDTPLDLQAGSNAGVRGVVGVLTGAHSAERLRQERHTHILGSIVELPDLVEKLGS
ncbi:MAG TPA: HAD hydrolase-like protein [Terriglobales bacterium]|nr:HAD hydrolase-like protein [Terriglobales bacterium]